MSLEFWTGSFVPERIVLSSTIAGKLDRRSDVLERIFGVIKRRSCFNLETFEFDPGFEIPEIEMGARAAEMAILDAGVDPKDITTVIFTPELTSGIPYRLQRDRIVPLWQIHQELLVERLGLSKFVNFEPKYSSVFDQPRGCADFHFALYRNRHILLSEKELVLAIASSASSVYPRLHPSKDLNHIITQFLFGDGAGAFISHFSSQNDKPFAIHAIEEPDKNPVRFSVSDENSYPESMNIYIDQKAIFDLAPLAIVDAVGQVSNIAHFPVQNIDWFFLHQPGRPTHTATVKNMVERFGFIEPERFPTNYQYFGNTGLASTPILLDQMRRSGEIKEGQLVIMASVGEGLRSAALLLKA